MPIVLSEMGSFAMIYLDDILELSETHEKHFRQVLERLSTDELRLKLPKCRFLKEETKYLCFVINRDGIKSDVKKVYVISVRQVKGFIYTIRYYMRFILTFSKLATP